MKLKKKVNTKEHKQPVEKKEKTIIFETDDMKLSYKSDLFKYNSYYHYNYSEPYEICINDHLSQNDSNKNEESMDVLEESKKK